MIELVGLAALLCLAVWLGAQVLGKVFIRRQP